VARGDYLDLQEVAAMNENERDGAERLLTALEREERYERRARRMIVVAWLLIAIGALAWVALVVLVTSCGGSR
jgi:CHASE3 domain sensor protein